MGKNLLLLLRGSRQEENNVATMTILVVFPANHPADHLEAEDDNPEADHPETDHPEAG